MVADEPRSSEPSGAKLARQPSCAPGHMRHEPGVLGLDSLERLAQAGLGQQAPLGKAEVVIARDWADAGVRGLV